MKRIVFTLCFFIVLLSVVDAARFYKCVDRDGNTIMTDNPPHDATCESKGAEKDLTPDERERERQQIQAERAARGGDIRTEEANARIDAAINSIKKDPGSKIHGGVGLTSKAIDRIVELEKARPQLSDAQIDAAIDFIKKNPGSQIHGGRGLTSKAMAQIVELEKARLGLQGTQADVEDKMNRQQREMEDKTNAMNAQMIRQQAEIQRLHMNQMMQQIDNNLGR